MFFDAHADIWCDITQRRLDGETDVFNNRHLAKFRKGRVEGSFFVIWVDPPHDDDYAKRTHEIMTEASKEIRSCDSIRIVHNYDEMEAAIKDNKIYIFIGVEGMAYVGDDLSRIDEYYDFGARECMLTWNEENSLGAGASSGADHGLTVLGKSAVRRIQELGMILDVSHLNEAGFWDVIDLARTPVIASHSNASALCPVPRNLTDDQLRAIAETGGVVGLNAYNQFIDSDPRRRTVRRLAEHAYHMIDIMGIDHVGLGFDFVDMFESGESYGDNGGFTQGLRSCTEIQNLFDCFTEMGMNSGDQEKIARGNFHRVIREVLK